MFVFILLVMNCELQQILNTVFLKGKMIWGAMLFNLTKSPLSKFKENNS